MKRVLLTGVTGFVGTNLVSSLSRSAQYRIFGHSRNREKAKLVFKDFQITLVDQVSSDLLNELKIDTVIHLAGIAHDLSGKYKPQDYYEVNQKQTGQLFDEFVKSNSTQFIFLSSIKAAVDHSSQPADESIQPLPASDYGKSKLLAERHIQKQALPSGKKFYILRPCMIHGPGNKGNLNLLYRFVKMGIPYPLAAFHNQRSFLSIDNFAYVVEKIMSSNIDSGVYHVADNGFLSTLELYELIAQASSKKPRVWTLPKNMVRWMARASGNRKRLSKLTEDLMVSNQKLLTNLNCKLPFEMKEGLIKTIKSFRG
ncbi:MAG: NAD-dependent epimerase/dehydratase family protein [Bacteroidetes bacterium]|nr:NAD-dependent epimerase/dehydratase family protein [Bacteroidota bacterium]